MMDLWLEYSHWGSGILGDGISVPVRELAGTVVY
jgi:hypothetical protein